MRRAKGEAIYAYYKGDEFEDLGTADELAEKFNVGKRTILFQATPTYRRRCNPDNSVVVIKIGHQNDVL